MVSYRSARKIKDYIVRSKLYPLERNVGCGGCGNGRYQVCKSIKVTATIGSFTTKKSYKNYHKFDCNYKCLIYLFSCRTCSNQYTGNTTDHFRYRWNNYKMEARKAENGDMLSFYKATFCQMITKVFWKMLRLDRHKVLTPLSENITE